MALKVSHKFVLDKPDDPSSEQVKPSNWNDDHDIVSSPGVVLGRKANTGTGPVEELALAIGDETFDLSAMDGALRLPQGDDTKRPAPGLQGMVRYNTVSDTMEFYNGTDWVTLAAANVVPTGSLQFGYFHAVPAGWIWAHGSLGPTGSGASNTGDDKRALYNTCWVMGPTLCPMLDTGLPGVSADADWDASRGINMPDIRELVLAVTGDLAGSVPPNRIGQGQAGGFAGINAVFGTTWKGERGHTMTLAELVPHSHNSSGAGTDNANASSGAQVPIMNASVVGAGIPTPMNNVQPTMMLRVIVKL